MERLFRVQRTGITFRLIKRLAIISFFSGSLILSSIIFLAVDANNQAGTESGNQNSNSASTQNSSQSSNANNSEAGHASGSEASSQSSSESNKGFFRSDGRPNISRRPNPSGIPPVTTGSEKKLSNYVSGSSTSSPSNYVSGSAIKRTKAKPSH
jgi:hypothetical protein